MGELPPKPLAQNQQEEGGRDMSKDMNMIKLLTKRSFRSNLGRNLVAGLAVVLTTLMFTALFVLSQSMQKNMTEMAFLQAGHSGDATFKTITDEQIELIGAHPDVESYGRSIVVSVIGNQELSGRSVEMRFGTDQYAQSSFSYPTTGTMPQAADEIALDSIALELLGIPMEIGQRITLEWKSDMTKEEVNRSEFTLCGFWEGNTTIYASMAWVSEEFAIMAGENATANWDKGQYNGLRQMLINVTNEDYETTIDRILADVGLKELEYGINLANSPEMKASAMGESIPMYLGMLMVFVSGYLIIYNIFQISVTSDIQFFGKLKTLGTTTRQIKRILYGQANYLCLVGIPVGLLLGYGLGALLVPLIILRTGSAPATSFHPIIFIGSAFFAWITVMISCLRPARIAGKVSPVEALRYSDVQSGRKKQKRTGTASLFALAWSNLGRNKKRTVTVICSLTLGLVLLSSFYAQNASFDMDKYLKSLAVADYQIEDASATITAGEYNPQGRTISKELFTEIENLEGMEGISRLYWQEDMVPLTENARKYVTEFYAQGDPAEYVEKLKDYPVMLETNEAPSVLYGIDGVALEAITEEEHILSGSYDKELFATGDYVMALGVDVSEGEEPTFVVGDKVVIANREFTVMAVLKPLEPVTGGRTQHDFTLPFFMPADTFTELYPNNTLRKIFWNVTDEYETACDTMLENYRLEKDSTLPLTKRSDIEERYRNETRASSVMGIAISLVIAFVGILNFINSMVTAIIARKKEFAMIQSIGMTKKQLKKLLIYEGLDYAGLTLATSYIASTLSVGIAVRAMVQGGYTTFHFSLFPLVICTPIILIFAILIPIICFRNLDQQSMVERLRNTD